MSGTDDHEARISALEAQVNALMIHLSRLQALQTQSQVRAGEPRRMDAAPIAAPMSGFRLDEATLLV